MKKQIENVTPAQFGLMLHKACQSDGLKVEAEAALVVAQCKTADACHAFLLETLKARKLANGDDSTAPAYIKVRNRIRNSVAPRIAVMLGMVEGSTWNKDGFCPASGSAGKVSGKEKGKTGEQGAAGEAMRGALPKVSPATRLAAIVAEMENMVLAGTVSASDVEAQVLAMLARVGKASKAA